MTDKTTNFQLFGKSRMIALMKTQFEYFADLDARQSDFNYMKFDANSERLIYIDDYDNTHDLYHGIAGGKEVCLYHVNDDRNVEISGKSCIIGGFDDMAVKGAKTVNEYKLRKWTEENFQDDSVTFCMSSADQAVLADKKGQKMTIGINAEGRVDVINYGIAVQKDSIVEKLNNFSRDINNGKENTQPVKANNLEHQRDSKER